MSRPNRAKCPGKLSPTSSRHRECSRHKEGRRLRAWRFQIREPRRRQDTSWWRVTGGIKELQCEILSGDFTPQILVICKSAHAKRVLRRNGAAEGSACSETLEHNQAGQARPRGARGHGGL